MTIQVGDRLPDVPFRHIGPDGMTESSTGPLFAGRRVALFGIPGAFTPTCSSKHLPSFMANAEALRAKGIESLVCLSVNDAFVMRAWGRDQNVGDAVFLLPDGNADFTQAIGLANDSRPFGMGIRCRRFALVADDGVVTHLFVEEPGEYRVSSAEHMLGQI